MNSFIYDVEISATRKLQTTILPISMKFPLICDLLNNFWTHSELWFLWEHSHRQISLLWIEIEFPNTKMRTLAPLSSPRRVGGLLLASNGRMFRPVIEARHRISSLFRGGWAQSLVILRFDRCRSMNTCSILIDHALEPRPGPLQPASYFTMANHRNDQPLDSFLTFFVTLPFTFFYFLCVFYALYLFFVSLFSPYFLFSFFYSFRLLVFLSRSVYDILLYPASFSSFSSCIFCE